MAAGLAGHAFALAGHTNGFPRLVWLAGRAHFEVEGAVFAVRVGTAAARASGCEPAKLRKTELTDLRCLAASGAHAILAAPASVSPQAVAGNASQAGAIRGALGAL